MQIFEEYHTAIRKYLIPNLPTTRGGWKVHFQAEEGELLSSGEYAIAIYYSEFCKCVEIILHDKLNDKVLFYEVFSMDVLRISSEVERLGSRISNAITIYEL